MVERMDANKKKRKRNIYILWQQCHKDETKTNRSKQRKGKKGEWQGSFHTLHKKYVVVIGLYRTEACIELFYITFPSSVALSIFTMAVKGTLVPIHIALYLWLLSVWSQWTKWCYVLHMYCICITQVFQITLMDVQSQLLHLSFKCLHQNAAVIYRWDLFR